MSWLIYFYFKMNLISMYNITIIMKTTPNIETGKISVIT